MRVLDLFSGIGGFSIGLESVGMETVAFCEQNAFCQKILAQHWPTLPIHSDITELSGYEYRGSVELVCGGFPCQPFSVAGKQLGAEDDRALWPEMLRVIREVAPRWVIGENVSGIIPMELDKVLSDLEGEGYTCWTFVLPACAVDAHHRRDRVWVIAHTNSEIKPDGSVDAETSRKLVAHTDTRQRGSKNKEICTRRDAPFFGGEDVSNTNGSGLQRREEAGNLGGIGPRRDKQSERCFDNAGAVWLPEPNVGRVANGIPNRSHRLKALGNAVVPPLVAEIGRLVIQFDREMING
jgi:DNA (cytosine-5)-methyltransferase 1